MSLLCLSPTSLGAARASQRLCDEGGGILFGQAAFTFSRLASLVLTTAGDRRAILTPLAEEMCALWAGEEAGELLSGFAPGSGQERALALTLRELARGEVRPKDLEEAAALVSAKAAGRLRLIAKALRAYESRLGELSRLDGAGSLRAAALALATGRLWGAFAKDELLLSGFVSLSPAEWDLFVLLARRAKRTRVELPFFPDRPDLCGPAEPLLRRMESLHELTRVSDVEVELPSLEEGRLPRLSALLSGFGGGPSPTEASLEGEVSSVAGLGEAGELEVAGDVVLRLLESGFAPEEVVVVSSSPSLVASPLKEAFAKRGLLLKTSRGARASEVPVVRLVREALLGARSLEGRRAARLLGSSWLEGSGGIQGLPSLLARSGALYGRGPAAAALRKRAALFGGKGGRERERLLRVAERFEELEKALSPLAREATAKDHARRVLSLLDTLGIRRRAGRGPLLLAQRDQEALDCVEKAAEEVALAMALCGREAALIKTEEFGAWLGRALEELRLSPQGEPAAGAVELLQADELPLEPHRAAVLLGCGEGTFAAPLPPEPLLREEERQALNRHLRRQAVRTAASRRAEVLHRAFLALSAGGEAEVFVHAAPGPAGDGGPLSRLLVEALRAVGVSPALCAPVAPRLSSARTSEEALRAAARLGRAGVDSLRGTPLLARAAQVIEMGELEAERRGAVLFQKRSRFAGGFAGLSLELVRALLPEEWSATDLETHAGCPFRSFLRLLLELPDEAAPDLDIEPREEGNLLHALMERFVKGRVARGAWPPSGAKEDLEEADRLAEEVLSRFEREGRTGDPAAFAGRREAIRERFRRVVRSEALSHGGLTPRLIEHRFGGGARAGPVLLKARGQVVKMRGRIDRVDASTDRLLVIDYKNSRSRKGREDLLKVESFGKESFQVPAYLLAAARELPGKKLSATYALLGTGERIRPLELLADDPRLSPSGEGEEDFAARVVSRVMEMRAGEFPLYSRGCERCPFGAVCRFEGVASRTASEEG